MIARYDLAERIVSFDFSSWLVMAAAKGVTEIAFANLDRIRARKWPAAIATERFKSILWPMPALLGLACRIDDKAGEEMDFETDPSVLISFVRAGNLFPRYRTLLPPGKERYTVTIRRDWRLPAFNSNAEALIAFAKEIGGRVIDDYDVERLPLHERFALYAGAEMNFGTVTGPMHLITLSNHPAMIFKANVLADALKKNGIGFGGNYPWALPGQSLVWESDDLAVLRRHFKALS